MPQDLHTYVCSKRESFHALCLYEAKSDNRIEAHVNLQVSAPKHNILGDGQFL